MFAYRTKWNLGQNFITQATDNLRKLDLEVFDLTKSNPTACKFSYPEDKILKSFLCHDNLLYDPNAKGMINAREAVCRYYSSRNIKIDLDNILLTSSTSEGYSLLFKLLANPQETILFPMPSYPLFQFLCDINDVTIGYYKLKYKDKWNISLDSLENEDFLSRIKAFVAVNPNNPTGSIISPDELKDINSFCKNKGIAIICDEVFSDFLFFDKNNYISFAGNKDVLTFTLGGLSKTLGLPQMKLSWIIINGPKDLVKEAKQRLEVIADTYLSVNTPVQNALEPLLKERYIIQKQINERIKINNNCLIDVFDGVEDVVLLNSEGGWYSVLKISKLLDEEKFILDLIEKDNVLVHPGYFYDFEEEGYIILSLIVENDIFKKGLKIILNRIKDLQLNPLR